MQLYNLYLHIEQVLVNLMMQNLLNKYNDKQENTLISENVIPVNTPLPISSFLPTRVIWVSKKVSVYL